MSLINELIDECKITISLKLVFVAELLAPNQPVNTNFPETFANQYRSFNPDWFKRFGWIYYDINKDAALYLACIKTLSKGQIFTGNVESVFVKTRFQNWKKVLEKDRGLLKHQQSSAHNVAQRYVNAPVENHDVGEMTSSNITQLNPLSAKPKKWSNTLKQFVGKLLTNCLSVFDHFVRLALKGLKEPILKIF